MGNSRVASGSLRGVVLNPLTFFGGVMTPSILRPIIIRGLYTQVKVFPEMNFRSPATKGDSEDGSLILAILLRLTDFQVVILQVLV